MSLQQSLERLRIQVAKLSDLNSVLKFDCGADGVVIVDGRVSPHTVEFGNRDAVDVTITLSGETFTEIVNGRVNPGVAFVMGKIKVKGDKSSLLKLQKVL